MAISTRNKPKGSLRRGWTLKDISLLKCLSTRVWAFRFFSVFVIRISDFIFPLPPRPSHDLTRFCASMFAPFQHLDTVDKYVTHSGRILVWFVKSRVVFDFRRIEDYDVSKIAGLEQATFL